MIEKLILNKFTAFESLESEFSPGINVFIGDNDTGKTHILKIIYSACDVTRSRKPFMEKLNKNFLPSHELFLRLVKRSVGKAAGSVEVSRRLPETNELIKLKISLSTDENFSGGVGAFDDKQWLENPLPSVYIPVKDMLANAPGFLSLNEQRYIHFEEVYSDILYRAFLPPLRSLADDREKLLEMLQELMGGYVVIKNEEFFLISKRGEIEFTLVSEGFRKLALLWLLIKNGILSKGAVLCWDEPETNMNPRIMEHVVRILIGLQRLGVQIFLSTHNEVILEEFDLQTEESDKIRFHSLYRDENDEIQTSSTGKYDDIEHNAIDDTFGRLVDRDIQKSIKKRPKKVLTE